MCCITGNLSMTSAKYILHMPLFTRCQLPTALMSLIIGEFSARDPDLTYPVTCMQACVSVALVQH